MFANGMSGCAFNLATGEYSIEPGAISPHVFDQYDAAVTTPHALLWHPLSWEPGFETQKIAGLDVTFLQVIPVADIEFEWVRAKGIDALIDDFERVTPDIYDLSRADVVRSE